MDINLFSMGYPVTALGPGTRAVLWVAGCGKRCPGCVSPEMQDPNAGRQVPVTTLLRHLLRLAPGLEGITISGGEPFDQAAALEALLAALHSERPTWSAMVYSGYTLEELRGGAAEVTGVCPRCALLEQVDILIDGAYCRDVPQQHPLAGSGNQQIHYLTPRGEALRDAMESWTSQRINLGLGAGQYNMVIGVVDDKARAGAEQAIFGAINDACDDAGCPREAQE